MRTSRCIYMIVNIESCKLLMVSAGELIYPTSTLSSWSLVHPVTIGSSNRSMCLAHSRGQRTFHSVHVRWTEGQFVNCITAPVVVAMWIANLCMHVRIRDVMRYTQRRSTFHRNRTCQQYAPYLALTWKYGSMS